MPGPCDSLQTTRQNKIKVLDSFEKKKLKTDPGTTPRKNLNNDIKKVIEELKQIDIDIKACLHKHGINPKQEATRGKKRPKITNPTSLETAHNEPSHGTGSRKQIS